VEAIQYLRTGRELLTALPETPEVEQTYARARELCQQVEDTPQLFPVLRGLHRFYLVRGQFQTAHAFGEQCFRLAQQTQDIDLKRWNSVLP